MIESFILNIPETQLYQHVDYSDSISQQLSSIDQTSAIFMAVPTQYDESKSFLPVLVATKENDKEQNNWTAQSHGQIILSSLYSGDIKIIKLVEQEDKDPVSNNDIEYPEGYTPKVTTFYNCVYRDIPVELLPTLDPQWSINVQAVNTKSSVKTITFPNENSTEDNSVFFKKVTASEGTLPAELHENFKANSSTPQFSTANFVVESERSDLNIKETLMIHGNFNLPAESSDIFSFIPVHVMITSKDFYAPKLKTLLVPKSKTTVANNRLYGVFSFDLVAELAIAQMGTYDVSDEIYVSLISRGEFSDPKRIVHSLTTQ